MQTYIDFALEIADIARSFTDLVEVYSIDEIFIETTGTERLWGDAWNVARKFQQKVYEQTGVRCSIGIGPNKLVAKVCMDVAAKKSPEGIAEWTPDDIVSKMHPLPVRDLFGVGKRMERNFQRMGIKTIGDLAHYPVRHLKKRWGIMGEVYHLSAWGIDYSPTVPNSFHHEDMKGVGHHITLHRDYSDQREIEIVLLELTEEVCRRLTEHEESVQNGEYWDSRRRPHIRLFAPGHDGRPHKRYPTGVPDSEKAVSPLVDRFASSISGGARHKSGG